MNHQFPAAMLLFIYRSQHCIIYLILGYKGAVQQGCRSLMTFSENVFGRNSIVLSSWSVYSSIQHWLILLWHSVFLSFGYSWLQLHLAQQPRLTGKIKKSQKFPQCFRFRNHRAWLWAPNSCNRSFCCAWICTVGLYLKRILYSLFVYL